MPVSGRVFRPDFVPVSFSSFTFLREGINLLQSRQDGVAGTVTAVQTDLRQLVTVVLVNHDPLYAGVPVAEHPHRHPARHPLALVLDIESLQVFAAIPCSRFPAKVTGFFASPKIDL